MKQPIGPVMIDIEGFTLTPLEQEKIHHPNTGAVILFARNYNCPSQITKLIQHIRKARKGDILIAVDQEGGRVQRLQAEFSRLPAAAAYAQYPELAEIGGWLMASELLAVGVDLSFAPVLDIDCGISQIIGDRCFSQNPELATQLASRFRKGMRLAGMAATGKHFPGHGGVVADSHLTLPIDPRDLATLVNQDLRPFTQLIAEGLEGIMPAHIVYSQIDSLPAGFSKRWLTEILRGKLGFDGAIFSDDLSMAGASTMGDFKQRAECALQAGCDMVLVCNNPSVAEQVLSGLAVVQNRPRECRLKGMQGKPQYTREQLLKTRQWQQATTQLRAISHS